MAVRAPPPCGECPIVRRIVADHEEGELLIRGEGGWKGEEGALGSLVLMG